jgi:hypothetical protein
MKNRLSSGLFLVLSATCNAATLGGDALGCEDLQTLQFAVSEGFAARGGSEALRQAGLFVQFHEAGARSQQIYGDLAVREGRRLGTMQADQAKSSAERKVSAYRQIATTCAALPGQSVTVVERRPVSGVALVSAQVKGTPAQLWVLGASLSD